MEETLKNEKMYNSISNSQKSTDITLSPTNSNINSNSLNSPDFIFYETPISFPEKNLKSPFIHFEKDKNNQLLEEEKKELKNLLKRNSIEIPPLVIYESENNNHPLINKKYMMKDEESNDGSIPWITENSLTNKHKGILKLHFEIIDFYNFIKLTESERKLRYKAYNKIMEIINSKFPNYKGQIFGSFSQDLSLSNSDLDICLNFKNCPSGRNEHIIILSNILKTINKSRKFSKNHLITARIPIIRCFHKNTGIKIDISINRKCNYISNSNVKSLIKTNPCIQYLTLLIKFYLRQRKLNDVHQGGISSVLILNLVYAYLLYTKKMNLFTEQNLNLGSLLFGFFDFFGFKFQFNKIEINNKFGGFFKPMLKDNVKIFVNSPIDEEENLSKNPFQFDKVILAFQNAYECLSSHNSDSKSYLADFIIPNYPLRRRRKIIDKENENFNLK